MKRNDTEIGKVPRTSDESKLRCAQFNYTRMSSRPLVHPTRPTSRSCLCMFVQQIQGPLPFAARLSSAEGSLFRHNNPLSTAVVGTVAHWRLYCSRFGAKSGTNKGAQWVSAATTHVCLQQILIGCRCAVKAGLLVWVQCLNLIVRANCDSGHCEDRFLL